MATRPREAGFTLTLKSELLDLLYARDALGIATPAVPRSENPPPRLGGASGDAAQWQLLWRECVARAVAQASGEPPDLARRPVWLELTGAELLDRAQLRPWIQGTVADLQRRCSVALGTSTRDPRTSRLIDAGLRGLVVLPLAEPWLERLNDQFLLVSIRSVEDPDEFAGLR